MFALLEIRAADDEGDRLSVSLCTSYTATRRLESIALRGEMSRYEAGIPVKAEVASRAHVVRPRQARGVSTSTTSQHANASQPDRTTIVRTS